MAASENRLNFSGPHADSCLTSAMQTGAISCLRDCGEGCEQGRPGGGFGLIDENPRQGYPIASTRADCGLADDGHGIRAGRARGWAVRRIVWRRRFATSRAMLTREGIPGCAASRKVVAAPQGHRSELLQLQGRSAGAGRFRGACEPLPEKITFEPSPAGPSISDAAAGLDGFDLFAEKDVAQGDLRLLFGQSAIHLGHRTRTSTRRPQAAIRLLGSADSYGLSPADYSVTVPSAAADGGDARGPHDRTGALRDDAVGARAALRARRTDRPHRSQPHFRLPRLPGKDVRRDDACSRRWRTPTRCRPIWNRGIRRTPNTRRCASNWRR